MTLLATEFHPRPDGTLIVFAADRRITMGNDPVRDQKKIFPVPIISAGIGFFGLAEVPAQAGNQTMADWLQDFLYTVQPGEALEALANRLVVALNCAVPAEWLNERSGFHLAGFGANGQPEFWFVRNVDDDGEPTLNRYEAREEFQRRDAPNLSHGGIQIYRNGDIRPHVAAWERLDEAFGALLEQPDFKPITTAAEYLGWVRFKMETISTFYRQYCSVSIIGEPIDAFAFTASESVDV
jgi:hypothetical protein